MAGIRQFDEDAALEKALALFWQRGYALTSMPELANATGVQRGSLYNAYHGKEALFLRVFALYRERFLGQLLESLDKPTLRGALKSFLSCVIASMRTGEPTRGCLTTKTALGGETLEQPVREALQGLLDDMEAMLLERLLRVEEGAQLAMPPGDAARLIVTFTRGIVVIERVYQDETRMRATADMLIGLLLGPVASRAQRRRPPGA
jgi:TetR/AcrR family transcriptional regulator, transcriptional repressor for nem operon